MTWRTQINEKGVVTRYSDADTGEVISAKEYERRMQMQQGGYSSAPAMPGMYSSQGMGGPSYLPGANGPGQFPVYAPVPGQPGMPMQMGGMPSGMSAAAPPPPAQPMSPGTPGGVNPLIQQGAQMIGQDAPYQSPQSSQPAPQDGSESAPSKGVTTYQGQPPTAGMPVQGKNLRLEGNPQHLANSGPMAYRPHGFLDATSVAILLPTLVLLALIIAAAHKKRLFPWQTVRTFNPPSGLMTPREYERSFLCPPNLRRHGRIGKRNPNATWSDADGVVLPFGFLARTHLPVTIPIGRLPNKNMFIVAPTGSGKTTLMRAIIKALLAKPCVIIALEAKANDPNLDELREGFKYTVLPEAQQAGFDTLYFNPLDEESINWNPMDLSPIVFASSIVQDINSLEPEEQHWAERDHGYISGLAQLLKWGAVQVVGEDENGVASQVSLLPCNPRGLMRLVNNRRNIVESLRRLKNNPEVDPGELTELTQTLSSIIRTDTDWDKNIQGVRGRLRMFKNQGVLRVTEHSNVDIRAAMHKPTVLIFGAPASLGPDAESLASCFVYQLQQALHTRYGTVSVLPLFAFFDEYQTLNMDIAGRLSAIVRGANGGLTIMLQNVSQIAKGGGGAKGGATGGDPELKTIFSNAAVRVCLHNADETTARFFSDEIGKHAVVVPGVADHFQAGGFGVFPSSWNRIHSQQVVARVDPDAIKRMEKQHALVYLSPAGDPTFGETKPFMVDLRGIEEIARLHLLHYVSSRKNPPSPDGGAPSPDGVSPDGVPPQPAFPPGPGPVPSRATAGSFGSPPAHMPSFAQPAAHAADVPTSSPTVQSRSCPACGQLAGNRKFCINCGYFLGPTSTPVAEPQVQLETRGVLLDPGHSVAHATSAPYGQSATPVPVTVAPAPQTVSEPAPASGPPFPFARPSSGITMSAADEIVASVTGAPRGNVFQEPLQIAEALRQQSPPRQPVKSLTPDLSNLGLPQAKPAPQPGPEPGQTPPRSSGIEF